MTADQISLRDEAYYKEHMIEFILNKEVIWWLLFYLLYMFTVVFSRSYCYTV